MSSVYLSANENESVLNLVYCKIPVRGKIYWLVTKEFQVTWSVAHTILSQQFHCLVNDFTRRFVLMKQITTKQNEINLCKKKTIT